MSTIPPPINFTGISEFSSGFQTVLERSFTVADLPVKRLQSEQTNLANEQAAMSSLAADVRTLQDVFSSLGIRAAQGATTATSSNASVATVTAAGSPTPVSFDLSVTSIAKAAQETTQAALGKTDEGSLSSDGVYSLTVGSETYTFGSLVSGAGRTAGAAGGATPAPKTSVDISFSNGLTGSISAELDSFFVGVAAPSAVGAGDTVSVSFTSSDGLINESITTAALSADADADTIASELNTAIGANPELAGKVSFSAVDGKLKLGVDESAGVGFSFTSSSTGTAVSGLESGGSAGGHSAQEIAAALNAAVAADVDLTAAGVEFAVVNGEVTVTGNQTLDIEVTDNAQGTGFASGLAGSHSVGSFDDSLAGVRDHINSLGAGVTATIINTSSDLNDPQYRLTITADDTGATTLTLKDGSGANLISSANQGKDAAFTVNGAGVTTKGNTITDFAPGITLTLVGAGESIVAAKADKAGIKSKFTEFASAYNKVVSNLRSQIGETAGALSGSILVRETQATLRSITAYLGSGDVRAMASLGLELSDKGELSFDSAKFEAQAVNDFDDILSFLGDTKTGFAGNAYRKLKELGDPVTGTIQTAIKGLQESDRRLSKQIEEESTRVDMLIANLEARFQAADALLAKLEGQQTLLKSMFESNKRDD